MNAIHPYTLSVGDYIIVAMGIVGVLGMLGVTVLIWSF
jgi:hypothetical protein